MSVKRQDLRTFSVEATTTLQNVGEEGVGSAAEGVPANMRRYVWYYKAENKEAPTVVMSIFESVGGVLKLKDQAVLTQYTKRQHPEGTPDPSKPVFAFRQSGFIQVQTSGGNVNLTVGYYDAPPE